MDFSAVIVAAGSGSRAGQGRPKQWLSLGGKPILRWSAEALLTAGAARLVVVIPSGDEPLAVEALAGLKGWTTAQGGAVRAQSVLSGLNALADRPADEPVLVHDAARPFVTAHHVRDLLAALETADGALPALAVADTLKRRGDDGTLITVSREGLWRAQTPQAFRRSRLLAAYAAWPADRGEPTDEAGVVEQAGGRVALTPGDQRLMKLTYPEDFAMAEAFAAETRVTVIGQGFDAHRFGPGDEVWLCGVKIAHTQRLIGHSDADAGLHALTDALLGAIGEGDIGDHFPPTDPKWKGAASALFLEHAARLVRAKGGRIDNVDVTLICERPKIKPHRAAMRAKLAELLGLPEARVSVKATTTEQMGFTGREEGLAAQAICAVSLPA
ncbi:bifunctional 2-C-methyl-D-erythritol 4-phosphate cytidylyltransferase/2-C-methyl-D-erythritol 2,4-cyclodiphosphate synthase [Phenylobacterium montanum]|uniref:Bifunctional enzyme IspD/IspF n=1 Tax=Phenylobacterium montanum TaxID=2823693 RepID=A0A975IVK7_9CAUL|nr:bifunctional 2-C-methyl-D-erythritol 4-phosphate cytidylyltransferase/2-C-methyl-D-erythritol 2,4-cyclodiphosphate synthase [Caulobacter sp. S6]QUD88875.1 bifunctional 2-C-methyl-D-erythritol 4-phosphate cytidylyltransferase/2-C-methyl-D-erythritol 2,4-cyclodiphosphate synthase [Caulobacter sp. S6]